MDTWAEKIKAAHDMVSALCRPRGSKGSREWIMSIPAKPDYDPDLVITAGLRAAQKEIDRLAAENAEWKAAHAQLVIDYEQVLADLEASDEALEKLLKCELDPSQDGNPSHWTRDDLVSTLQAMQAILYPKETTDDNG